MAEQPLSEGVFLDGDMGPLMDMIAKDDKKGVVALLAERRAPAGYVAGLLANIAGQLVNEFLTPSGTSMWALLADPGTEPSVVMQMVTVGANGDTAMVHALARTVDSKPRDAAVRDVAEAIVVLQSVLRMLGWPDR